MRNVKVLQYQPSDKHLWDSFVLDSNQQTFLFQRGFMDYHSDRFSDFSLMIYMDDKLIALLPANKVGNELHSHQGLTYGGIICNFRLKSEEVIVIFKAILQFLNQSKIEKLHIKELPFIYLDSPINNPFSYLYFKVSAQLYRMDMHSVVKPTSLNYSRSRKNGIKRAEKHDLIVEETDDFSAFWNEILIPNLDNKHDVKPVHSLDEIQLLKSRFPQQIRQFNVLHEGKIVAGTTIFDTKNVAHSQYISGNKDKNTLGSLDFLHRFLLQNVFADKSYFNFGISHLEQGQLINEGLMYWKEGFGAHSVTQGFYTIDTNKHGLLEDIFV
ncbi:GNAT family N-acetyltransferase [Winogradskyella tangerina]|uniref:GNAT family N-acetyltransferase n=1 Tax=Winogradskyella tangerina TaxID=2023240 RepID=UPI000DBE1B8D|nr:GNAT family N-acetyltransferase [Winogradskyella tangerina]